MPMEIIINPESVLIARKRLKDVVCTPPILASAKLNRLLTCQLFIQCENQQITGSFKYRGASNAVLGLLEQSSLPGVCSHSSGNHGQALAKAARLQGIRAEIVVPENAVPSKLAAISAEGAMIHLCESNQQAREYGMEKLVKTGLTPISPYDHPLVIAGQGTWALDILEQVSKLDILLVPVGGGGLAAGTIMARDLLISLGKPALIVVAVEPEQADDCWRSWQQGQRVLEHHPNTIADGLRAKIGKLTFSIIKSGISTILRVSENEILNAVELANDYLQQHIEPSSATVLAALRGYPEVFAGHRVGTLFTGGNTA